MSWKVMNEVIGLAMIDPDFCQSLLLNPLNAVRKRGFTLTVEEENLLRSMKVNDMAEFSQILLASLPSYRPSPF